MNDMLFRTLLKRYEATIEDSLYKIQSFNENNIIIPEHIDITGEVDKLLQIIAEAEDKDGSNEEILCRIKKKEA